MKDDKISSGFLKKEMEIVLLNEKHKTKIKKQSKMQLYIKVCKNLSGGGKDEIKT